MNADAIASYHGALRLDGGIANLEARENRSIDTRKRMGDQIDGNPLASD